VPSNSKLLNYLSDKTGNMTVLAAGSLTVIMLAVGAAIDISDLASHKSSLQDATDSAVLAAAISGETDTDELTNIAREAFDANFGTSGNESIKNFNLLLSEDGELSLETQLEKPTLIMGAMGMDKHLVTAEAATYMASSMPLDIALVLDRTGSMAGPNMAGLISAATDFISSLDSGDRDVRVAIIPFSDYVNVGVDNASERWLDLSGVGPEGSEVSCVMEDLSSSSCLSTGLFGPSTSGSSSSGSSTSSGSCATSTTSTSSSGSTATSSSTTCSGGSTGGGSGGTTMSWSDVSVSPSGAYCTASSNTQDVSTSLVEACVPVDANENWFGCVGSRATPDNTRSGYDGRKVPPIYNRTCGQPMTELTDNLGKARREISNLTASGSTYIPAGLQWGWRALTPSDPFDAGGESDRKKLLILMTDGQNTVSQNGAEHSGNDYAGANDLTLALCNEIKSASIELATVSYSNGGMASADGAMLSGCASSESLYFLANDTKSLLDAFSKAASKTNEIRLVR
jgi:Mg-chelatase subunit ChlD